MAYSENERVSVMLVSFPHVHKCTMLVVGRHDIKIKILAAITKLSALLLFGKPGPRMMLFPRPSLNFSLPPYAFPRLVPSLLQIYILR